MTGQCFREARFQFGVSYGPDAIPSAVSRETAALLLPDPPPPKVWYCHEHADRLYKMVTDREIRQSVSGRGISCR